MRTVSKHIYLTAGVITLVVFLLGVLLGIFIESKRVGYMEVMNRGQNINYESLQLQYLYLSTLENKTGCAAFSVTLNEYIKQLEKTRGRLETYLRESSMYDEEFKTLKREYTIAQLNYWILSRKSKDLCNSDFVTLLYFYSKDCKKCEDQGFILDHLKLTFGDKLLIFALDAEMLDEPTVTIVKKTYGVTTTPTVVIEDSKIEGFVDNDSLMSELCSKYREKPEKCG